MESGHGRHKQRTEHPSIKHNYYCLQLYAKGAIPSAMHQQTKRSDLPIPSIHGKAVYVIKHFVIHQTQELLGDCFFNMLTF